MLHTKTKAGYYSDKDYWIVSWKSTTTGKTVEKEYSDVDNAYEDYCYYKKKGYPGIKYEHRVRK